MSFLSGTAAGEAWLQNFDTVDKPIAKKLLDGLLLVSSSEFNSKMTKQIAVIAACAREAGQVIALYPSERWLKQTAMCCRCSQRLNEDEPRVMASSRF